MKATPRLHSLSNSARWRRRRRSTLSGFITTVLAVTLLQAPASARPDDDRLSVEPEARPVPTVPVTNVATTAPTRAAAMRSASAKPAPIWPSAATAVAELDSSATVTSARVGGLPVRVERVGAASSQRMRAQILDIQRVRVQTLDRKATERAGIRGVLMRVGQADTAATDAARADAGSADLRMTVDYSSFATAYGADWATRLRLVTLPECALTTPEQQRCAGTPLKSRNNPVAQTVSAQLPVAAAGTLVAVAAGATGPAGDYSATPLQPSSTWSVGGNTGSFNWSYPMRVPPAPGGLEPDLAFGYSSQSVDGRHAASNNQPSWVGEGFEFWPGGYIERRYRSCAKDTGGNNTTKTYDLCWETDNATLHLDGFSGELLYNSSEQRWHLRTDDGARIVRHTGAANGDEDGEFWTLTTTDGTEYRFGSNRLPGWTSGDPVTNSAWNAPVFGNDVNEPCRKPAFADSSCERTWRWNLEHVANLNGDSMSFWYTKETNKYGRNKTASDAVSYDRGGYLKRIDYGTRVTAGRDSALDNGASARVVFTEADRCLSNCTTKNEVRWPDTPWDSECTGSTCVDKFSPTFWSSKRLSAVTTQIRSGSGFSNVERWSLTHGFPDPGDGTRAGLWLEKISHEGLVGGSTTLPDVELTGIQLANRVDTIDFAAAMNWWRIARIRNETGGTINITYSQEDCVAGSTPTAQTNTRRCYPVRWTPEGYQSAVTDWFHKYVVTTIYEIDHTGGSPPFGSPRKAYSYSYHDGAAWRYTDDDGLVDKDEKTWSVFRGYGRVGVTVGDAGEQAYTETRYFRGMHGDRAAPSGGTKSASLDGITDQDWFAGMAREVTVRNGPTGAVVSREVSDPWASGPTASRTANGDTTTARFVRVGTARSYVALDGGRGERVTRTTTSFDSLGMPTQVDDFGVEGTTGDERCTKTDYIRRDTKWLMDRVQRTRDFAVSCSASNGTLTEADVIGETRLSYDDAAYGTLPANNNDVRGLPTRTEVMAAWNAGAPSFVTKERTAYDSHGRPTSSWDAMNFLTTTTYTPALGGPTTQVVVKNPRNHETRTTLIAAWGSESSILDPNEKRTELAYDALGRLTSVWLPNRSRATESANMTFGYTVRNNAPTAVRTSKLNAEGNYVSSYELFDGLLRTRQTQAPSPAGGRLITETFYDTAGRKVREYDKYHTSGDPGTTLATAVDGAHIHTQNRIEYDGAGRPTAVIFQPYNAERWRTSIHYGGDREDVTPPTGGTATSAIIDARGNRVEQRRYHGAAPTPWTTGSWDTTTYTYNRKNQLTMLTDAAGNSWTYTFDIRGRQIQVDDPDSGTSTFTYDNADRMTSSTDGRNRKLAYRYDQLGRKIGVYENSTSGVLRAEWQYDTLAKGLLTRSIREVDGLAYQVEYLGYTDLYQESGVKYDIPTTEPGIGGAYLYEKTWNLDGSLSAVTLPNTNSDLPAETLRYGYDALGQPKTLSRVSGSTTSNYVPDTDYNALGQVENIELYTGSGARVWQGFDRELETGRITDFLTTRDAINPGVLADLEYSYDEAGNITRISDKAPDPVDDTQCFAYDHLRQLTQAWTPASGDCAAPRSVSALGGPAPYWHSWTINAVGNRTSQTVHTGSGDQVTTYTYPSAGAARPHAVTATAGAQVGSYTYDNSGNTLTRPTATAGTQTLTWDHEGRLESTTDSTGVTSYLYDADGNRLIRRDPTGTTLYLPGQEIRHNTNTNQTSCTRYYTHAGKTVASRSAAGLTWLVEDHQRTAQVAVDAATGTATTRRQTPYGTVRGSASGWPNDKGFVGGTVESAGLVFIGVRAYDPATGRFISIDPLQDHDDPLQWHGYAYANNSPITFSDPDGLKPLITDSVQGDEKHYRETGEKVVYQNGKWTSNKSSSSKTGGGTPDIFRCDKQTTCTIRGQDKDTKNVVYECNSPGSCIIENRARGSGAVYNCNVPGACQVDADCRNGQKSCSVGNAAVDGKLACRVRDSCIFYVWKHSPAPGKDAQEFHAVKDFFTMPAGYASSGAAGGAAIGCAVGLLGAGVACPVVAAKGALIGGVIGFEVGLYYYYEAYFESKKPKPIWMVPERVELARE